MPHNVVEPLSHESTPNRGFPASCVICGKEFFTVHIHAVCCSDDCRREHHTERQRFLRNNMNARADRQLLRCQAVPASAVEAAWAEGPYQARFDELNRAGSRYARNYERLVLLSLRLSARAQLISTRAQVILNSVRARQAQSGA
jgi:hypothetical protein